MRENKESLFSISYRAFYVLLLCGICLTGFGDFLGIHEVGGWNAVVVLMVLGALLAITCCRLRGKVAGFLLLIVTILLLPVMCGVDKPAEFWQNYANWMLKKEDFAKEWVGGYGLVQSILVVLGCYIFEICMEKIPILKDGSALLCLAYLLISMFRKEPPGQMTTSFLLWYILLCFVEWTQRCWKKKKSRDGKEYLIRILPFCVLYLILMLLMPVQEEPYDWQFVKDAYHKIHEKFTVWMQDRQRNGQEDFGTAQVGFSEDGRLMSSLVDSDRHLLTIQGSSGLMTNVYLVGKIYDEFDGTKWSQTITEDDNERLMDTLETLYAVKRYDEELTEDYVYSTGLSVWYEYFNTGYVFAPLKMQSVEGCEYVESGSNLLFEEQVGYGTKYKVIYFQLNVDHPRFYEMAQTPLAEDTMLWEEIVKSHAPKGSRSLTLEDLGNYRQNTMTDYGKEVILSEEAEAYLKQITQGAKTDVEKLRAIEKELSGYTYSKNLGKLPEDIDDAESFLDYFLLEKKEGYCSYFATAFVLLARAEGIPARYVEGFCVPVTSNKNMTVTSGMAHAWPEVYLEGVGWIPFEPTPGYEEIRYTPWKLKSERGGMSLQAYEEELYEEEEVLQEEADLPQEEEKQRQIPTVLWVVIGLSIASAVLILLLDKVWFGYKYSRMNTEQRFLVEVKRYLLLLSYLGVQRGEDETLEELQNKSANVLGFASKMQTLTSYEGYLYGSKTVTENALQVAKEERNVLLSRIKQNRKWFYYLVLIRVGLIWEGR